MFKRTDTHKLIAEQLPQIEPNWDMVAVMIDWVPVPEAGWDARYLIGALGEAVVSSSLDQIAKDFDEEEILLRPIDRRTRDQTKTYKFRREQWRTVVRLYEGSQKYGEYDEFAIVDGVPTVFEVKLKNIFTPDEFTEADLQKKVDPVRRLYPGEKPGFMLVTYPECQDRVRYKVESIGGWTAPFFTSQEEFAYEQFPRFIADYRLPMSKKSLNNRITERGTINAPGYVDQ